MGCAAGDDFMKDPRPAHNRPGGPWRKKPTMVRLSGYISRLLGCVDFPTECSVPVVAIPHSSPLLLLHILLLLLLLLLVLLLRIRTLVTIGKEAGEPWFLSSLHWGSQCAGRRETYSPSDALSIRVKVQGWLFDSWDLPNQVKLEEWISESHH